MSGKILMFEVGGPEPALSVARAMAALGVEVIPVERRNYHKPLEKLLQSVDGSDRDGQAGVPLGGPMLVLCGVEDKLDEVLTALRSAGVGVNCLKAVLTKHNRMWTAGKLYAELRREQQEMMKR